MDIEDCLLKKQNFKINAVSCLHQPTIKNKGSFLSGSYPHRSGK
jgi:hypothetical protein